MRINQKKKGGGGAGNTRWVKGHSINQLTELKIEHLLNDENYTIPLYSNEKNAA